MISGFKAILDIFTFLPGPLEDTFWSHGAKQILHFLQVAPDHLSPPATKQKQRPSQASVCHEAQSLMLNLTFFPKSPHTSAGYPERLFYLRGQIIQKSLDK